MHTKQAIQSALCLALGAISASVLNVSASVDATWQPQAFSRYEGIISRMPFGVPPPAGPTAAEQAAAKAPPPPFASALVLCALNRTPSGGLAVGFMDNSQKPPKSYYLERGESSDGFTVTSASFDQECATIEKDGVSVELKMAKGATVASAKPAPAMTAITPVSLPAPPAPPANTRPSGPRLPPMPPTATDPSGFPVPRNLKAIDAALQMGISNESYVDRLKKRREEIAAAQATQQTPDATEAAVEARTATVFESYLRRKNLEMIRKGEDGLGIQLTPEEDAQLVKEGVLPAQ